MLHANVTPGIPRAYLPSRWGQLHYRAMGDSGPALVFLHQSATSSRMWDPILPTLAETYRCVAFDTPGYGQSDPPPGQTHVQDYVDVFFDAMDRLGIARATLVGFHTGATFAVEMAVKRPDRVERLILMGVPLFPEADRERIMQASAGGWAPDPDGQYLLATWRKFSNPNLWVKHRETVDTLLAGPNYYWVVNAIFNYDLRPTLRAITQPTLILHSPKDFLA
ncbi:MAG: alpha/beta fold hydrolase, partial [Dehalococcoidia bacterium]|nr:alpha/beta fold hydrolase [Dehalococcoidia bacterium]